MIQFADYDLIYDDIQLPFFLGEKAIFNLNYKGFRRHIDAFGTPEISSPSPPVEELKSSGYRIALTYSIPVARKMPKIAFRQGYICFTLKHYRRLYIDTNREFEQYLERFKSKTISTIRRKVKKATNSCESGPGIRVFTTPEEITEFVGIAREISRNTFQYRLLRQGLQDNERYMNDYLRKAEEKKIVGLILYAEDKPVAYNLCPIYGDGVMIYYYTGFDTDYSNYSPGTILQYHTINTAFTLDHVKYYDFCTGGGQHKEMFTDEYKICADIIYFPLNPRYLFTVLFKLTYDALLNIIKYPVRRLGKADNIKKMIRSKAKAKKAE